MEFTNVPKNIATVISARLATLHELDSVYGLVDLYDLLEINAVSIHNHNVMNRED